MAELGMGIIHNDSSILKSWSFNYFEEYIYVHMQFCIVCMGYILYSYVVF